MYCWDSSLPSRTHHPDWIRCCDHWSYLWPYLSWLRDPSISLPRFPRWSNDLAVARRPGNFSDDPGCGQIWGLRAAAQNQENQAMREFCNEPTHRLDCQVCSTSRFQCCQCKVMCKKHCALHRCPVSKRCQAYTIYIWKFLSKLGSRIYKESIMIYVWHIMTSFLQWNWIDWRWLKSLEFSLITYHQQS